MKVEISKYAQNSTTSLFNLRFWCFNRMFIQGRIQSFPAQDLPVDRDVHANDGIARQVVVQHPRQAQDNLDRAQREANRQRTKV